MKGNLSCPHTKPDQIDPNLIALCNRIEMNTVLKLIVTSGVRCPACNATDGGKPASAHLPDKNGISHALDISVSTSHERYILMKELLKDGVCRIGVGKTFLHLDLNKDNPQEVIWDYYV